MWPRPTARSKEPVAGASEKSLNFCPRDQSGDVLPRSCRKGDDSGATGPGGPQCGAAEAQPRTQRCCTSWSPETQPGQKPECPHFSITVDKLPLCRVSVTCSSESGHRYPWIPALTGLSNCPSPSSEACDTTKIPVTPGICLSWVCCAQTLCALTVAKLTLGFEQRFMSQTEGRSQMLESPDFSLPGQSL